MWSTSKNSPRSTPGVNAGSKAADAQPRRSFPTGLPVEEDCAIGHIIACPDTQTSGGAHVVVPGGLQVPVLEKFACWRLLHPIGVHPT